MIILHHNKDMDGWASGAICRMKYPKAKLVGWDYAEPIPDFAQFKGKNVIMIDITFSLEKCLELGAIVKSLVILDHHISFKKQVDN